MMTEIDFNQTSGKMIKKIHCRDEALILVFEDKTFCVFEPRRLPYEDDYSISQKKGIDGLWRSTIIELGIMSEEELDKTLEAQKQEYYQRLEQHRRETYQRLKEEFEP